jgi:L-iditol 2-dehydrogenase
MKAVFLTGLRRVEVRRADEPALVRDDDVLLDVRAVGLCGSDMHYFRAGRIGDQVVRYPWIIGHEIGAAVAAIGPKVRNVKVGDRVAVDPLITCGRCDQCRQGRHYTCRDQRFLGTPPEVPGGLTERLVMPAECCFKAPDSLSAEQAAMVEPLSIALWAAHFAGDPTGRNIAILGAGTMGLCTLAALRAAGSPRRIFATDLLDNRLALAAGLGADATANAARDDVLARGRAVAPEGFDTIFECAGELSTLDQAAELLAPGGKLVIVGIAAADRVSFDLTPLRKKELVIQNVRRQNGTVAATIEMMAAGRIDVSPLVTHHFALADIQAALDLAADRRDGVVKAMVTF